MAGPELLNVDRLRDGARGCVYGVCMRRATSDRPAKWEGYSWAAAGELSLEAPATADDGVSGGPTKVRVAVVHDWLITVAGAERVLAALLEVLPGADVYTLLWDGGQRTAGILGGAKVHTSFLQRIPGAARLHRLYLPLMPLAVEAFDLRTYEVIVSSSHAVAKGVRAGPDQLHISYVHTPARYAWDLEEEYLGRGLLRGSIGGAAARIVLHYLRLWDVASAHRVDVFVANSKHVARRIWRIYRRRATVVYPPVEVGRFSARRERGDWYVTVTRLVPYKRVDVIVEAFGRLGRPLVVIGDGPEADRLRRRARRNVELLGWQPETVVQKYLEGARAFVFAAEEDFGIAAVEAQAAGAPVIAYGRGGVTESVVEGETGLFFYEQTPEALVEAVLEFERREKRFSVERIRLNAERFSKGRFKKEFSEVVERHWEVFRRRLRSR